LKIFAGALIDSILDELAVSSAGDSFWFDRNGGARLRWSFRLRAFLGTPVEHPGREPGSTGQADYTDFADFCCQVPSNPAPDWPATDSNEYIESVPGDMDLLRR
jgi:hypothetical protein